MSELLKSTDEGSARGWVCVSLQAEEMKECTFKPKLHKSPMRHRRRRPAAGTAPSSPTNGAARGPPAENNKGALWENGKTAWKRGTQLRTVGW